MKKVLLFLVLLALSNIPVKAQTTYWSENFHINNGWTLQQNWNISNGMMEFYFSPVKENFDLSAMSPVIDLHPNTQTLSLRQHLNIYSSSNPPEMAEIIVVSGTTQTVLWSHPLSSGSWGTFGGNDLELDVSAFAGQSVRLKFRTHGLTTWNWSWWQVFEIRISAVFQHDLAAVEITGPVTLIPSEPGTWSVQVKNNGLMTQQGFSVSLYSMRFGNLLGTVSVSEPIEPQQTMSVDFNWTPTFIHNTVLYAEVNSPGDEFPVNNTSPSKFLRVKPDYNIQILVWDNDNGISTILCPEESDLIRATDAFTRTLTKAGVDFQVVNELPQNLNTYNIVFVSLGTYCLS